MYSSNNGTHAIYDNSGISGLNSNKALYPLGATLPHQQCNKTGCHWGISSIRLTNWLYGISKAHLNPFGLSSKSQSFSYINSTWF